LLFVIGYTRSSVVLMVELNAIRHSWLIEILVSRKVLITLGPITRLSFVEIC
jgi:hypothetical protein